MGGNPNWKHLKTSTQFDQGLDSNAIVSIDRSPVVSSKSLFVESLIDELSRLMERDPKRQIKLYNTVCAKLREMRLVDESYSLEELSSLRGHYRRAFAALLQRPHLQFPLLETSRYSSEFEELGWIASGGFGQVFKARHRLDCVEYAIKKVKVKYKEAGLLLRTLSEVRTLARLNHANIVQYKAAWLEATSSPHRALPVPLPDAAADTSDVVVFEGTDISSPSSEITDDLLSLCPVDKNLDQRQRSQTGAMLYVSMQLCDETLRQWLDRRNATNIKIDIAMSLRILEQAAQGLAFIHASNVVHHDIKPSNVFITQDLRVLVGDFGLACNLGGGQCPVIEGNRGTGLYAAPEQLQRHCHPQSDIFSLGLVFLELLCPFNTNMERATVLQNARGRIFPNHIPLQLKDLLLNMLALNPIERLYAPLLLEQLKRLLDSQTEDSCEKGVHADSATDNNFCDETDVPAKRIGRKKYPQPSTSRGHSSSIVPASINNCLLDEKSFQITSTRYLESEIKPISQFDQRRATKDARTDANPAAAVQKLDDIKFESSQHSGLIESREIKSVFEHAVKRMRRREIEDGKTITELRQIGEKNTKIINELRATDASNIDIIEDLRRQLNEKDNEIRKLRNCLSRQSISHASCGEEARLHSI